MTRIVDVAVRTVPIASDISNSYVSFSTMTASVIAILTDQVRDGKPVVGYGFNSNGRYGQTALLQERFLPRLKKADPRTLLNDSGDNFDPERIWSTLMTDEKPGGHGERSAAVGTVDMAVWDAVAKIEGVPLHHYLASRYGSQPADEDVFVYAAGGYYAPGKTIQDLKDEMSRYLDLGYNVVKLKIGGADLATDLARIEAVCDVTGDPARVAVDANGRFDLTTALDYARALAPYELYWYEEAGDPLDYALNRTLAEYYDGPLATGENIFSLADSRNLVRYAGMRPDRDTIQIDPVLSYGLVEYRRILSMLRQCGWSARRCIPHGGHQLSLAIAAGLGLGGNESYPGVFGVFGGFADDIPVVSGRVKLPAVPGIGFEAKRDLFDVMRDLSLN